MQKGLPSVVDELCQETARNGCNMRRVGKEDSEDSHCATSFVEEETVGHYTCSNGEEGAGSNTVKNLIVCKQALFEFSSDH
jgi:hypothetical protein